MCPVFLLRRGVYTTKTLFTSEGTPSCVWGGLLLSLTVFVRGFIRGRGFVVGCVWGGEVN